MGPLSPLIACYQRATKLLLASFKEMTLVLIDATGKTHAHLTALSPLQQHILELLEFPADVYTWLSPESDDPP